MTPSLALELLLAQALVRSLELRARRLLALRRLKTTMATSAINAKGSPTPNPNPNQSGSGEDGPGERGGGGGGEDGPGERGAGEDAARIILPAALLQPLFCKRAGTLTPQPRSLRAPGGRWGV